MSRASTMQTNFSSGELSPFMHGRADLSQYANGCSELENFITKPQGGVYKRSGTRLVNEVKTQSLFTRLIAFEFSDIQGYVLEFGNLYMRIHMDGGTVEDGGSPVEIVTPWATADLPNLAYTQSADTFYVCHPDYAPRKITRTSHIAWTIETFETVDGPYLPNNITDTKLYLTGIVDRETLKSTENDFVIGDEGKFVEYSKLGVPTIGLIITYVSATEVLIEPKENIVEPLSSEVTFETVVSTLVTITQQAFTRFIIGAYLKVVNLSGAGTEGWYLVSAYDGADRDQCTVTLPVLTLVATTGVLTTQDRDITGTLSATEDTFSADDVGRQWRLNLAGNQVWGTITAYTSATEVTTDIETPMPLKDEDPTAYAEDGGSTSWRLGAWSVNTGYPTGTTFHEERLVFAGSTVEPQTVWMSKTADFENFAPTELDSDVSADSAITFTLASNKVNAIRWLRSANVLVIGTRGAEWRVSTSKTGEPISPTTISASVQTTHGSSVNEAEIISSSILFVQASGNKVRELSYEIRKDSYVSEDVTILSEHVLQDGSGGTYIAYQEEPDNILWVLRSDGQVSGLTYLKDQGVAAWHRQVLGGTDPVVESIATVTSSIGNTLYMIVSRTIDGATTRYIEYLEDPFYPASETDKDDMMFMDSALSYGGVPVSTVSGLDHLEGETVSVVADGSVLPDEVVASGAITITDPASVIHVGLAFVATLTTLPLEGGGDTGPAQGKTKVIDGLAVRLVSSLGFQFGELGGTLDTVSFRGSADVMDSSPPLFTGDKDVIFGGSYNLLGQYQIRSNQPYPLTVTALMPRFRTYEAGE